MTFDLSFIFYHIILQLALYYFYFTFTLLNYFIVICLIIYFLNIFIHFEIFLGNSYPLFIIE
jgi:hypothetical protein